MKDFSDLNNSINKANTKISISNSSSKDIIFQECDNHVMFSAYNEGDKELQLNYNKNKIKFIKIYQK